MKKYYSFVLIFLIPYFAKCQNMHLIDSLNRALEKHKSVITEHGKEMPSQMDTTAANILNELCLAWWFADPIKAREYAKQTLDLSQQIGYKKGMGNSYNNLGSIDAMSGKYDEAMIAFNKSIELRNALGDKKGLGTSISNLGNLYNYQGNYPEALKHYYESLKLFEETGYKIGQARVLSNIATIYIEQVNFKEVSLTEKKQAFDQALKFDIEALNIRKEINDSTGMAVSYNNLGSLYRLQYNFDKAIENYKAAQLIKEALNDKRGLALNYQNIGTINSLKGNYKEANDNFQKSLKYYAEIKDEKGVGVCYAEMGHSLLREKKFINAITWFNKSLSISSPLNDLETIASSYEGLYRSDSALNDLPGQLRNYQSYITMRDSLTAGEKSKQVTQLHLQYEFDKKQFSDSLNFAKEKIISEINLARQRSYTIIAITGSSITIILLFGVYYNYRKQRIANRKLREAQEQLIRQEKMAAFGVMASRVSHEIQNPLNFVNNFSELSQEVVNEIIHSKNDNDKKTNGDLLITNLKKINEHGRRASDIVKQLQEHSIKGTAGEFFES